ncbi:hypothetical protein JK2ML_1602 [Mycobacterium leprae Kyoto-2]|uniref:Uncharacterized protein n=5 Tax=Mycobacterium leprae TaxID=1769 RepID=Q9CBT9_MYCLE|nr:hypothetical protein [Mycobacterium leprae]OAX71778.1 hypothetical protein A3216_03765 [Mycobacterium leprae 7935681]CAR71697.1 hypothetical protein MLBr01602 [Mycobacterium leprae Br4923]AWV48121.1 hypothetical protein DIJ64_08785 [Mycobacterium leprae]OAR21622.1 hypothetical protein A8144_05040 [Mycobacterium leprae 3125609]CAC30553.1 hypothetical protein [Mycobacterium leprae]
MSPVTSCKPHFDRFSVGFNAASYLVAILSESNSMADCIRVPTAQVLGALLTVPGISAFHAEIFYTPDDRLVLCEIACCATGPAVVVDIHEEVSGVDLHGASLLCEV